MSRAGASYGAAHLRAHAVFHPATWSIAPRCYLDDLYVDTDARGRGLGRILIEAIYALADERGTDRTCWLTQADNATARRLYDTPAEEAGFAQYRR